MPINLVKGDITKLKEDAIVNAANSSLLGGGGVDGAIHAVAGEKLYEECLTLGGCKIGEAKITKGYKLPSKFVIHTVGPVYDGREEDAKLLSSCYKNSLDLALKHGLKTIAFPCISTGVYGYPIKEAAELSFKTISSWLKEHDDSITVTFCCFSDSSYREYERLLKVEAQKQDEQD